MSASGHALIRSIGHSIDHHGWAGNVHDERLIATHGMFSIVVDDQMVDCNHFEMLLADPASDLVRDSLFETPRRSGLVTGQDCEQYCGISQLWDDLIQAGIRDHKLHVIDAKDADSLAYETAK